MTIFVSIAAYRDRELVPTVLDCLDRAHRPDELRFGIVWQHGEEEDPLPFSGDRRFRILDVHWSESRGACWARAEAMRLFNGEDWFFQIDSHQRFAQDWDAKLQYWAQRTGSPKPLLSAGQPGYELDIPREAWATVPRRMVFGYWLRDGLPNFIPETVPTAISLDRPIRSRYVSAGLCFAPGRLVDEVPYDPDLYFAGEEIMLTVRAFTCGYDLFLPPEVICWHDYNFRHRRRHWEDHTKETGVEVTGGERSQRAVEKISRFLADPWVGRFGAGTARSVADYEHYSGISFGRQEVQAYTLRGEEPPNPPSNGAQLEHGRRWTAELVLDRAALPQFSNGECLRWTLAFYDEAGTIIRCRHVYGAELERLERCRGEVRIERDVVASSRPLTYRLDVMTAERGWLPAVRGEVTRSSLVA